jgi:hypothetical protein
MPFINFNGTNIFQIFASVSLSAITSSYITS